MSTSTDLDFVRLEGGRGGALTGRGPRQSEVESKVKAEVKSVFNICHVLVELFFIFLH